MNDDSIDNASNTNSQSNYVNNQDSDSYPSASIMLEISREEYVIERERSTNLDTKANIFISTSIAIVALYVPRIPFQNIINAYRNASRSSIALITIGLCMFCLAFISLMVAFYNLFNVLSVKPVHRVSFENLNNIELLHNQQNNTEQLLLEHYNKILVKNAEINNGKSDNLKQGLKYSTIFFILMTVSAIFLLIIIG